MVRRVVWQKFTGASEVLAPSKAGSISETSVNFYQTTRRNIPEDSHLRTHRRGNLKSHQGHYVRDTF
jgi:hypothetical protein